MHGPAIGGRARRHADQRAVPAARDLPAGHADLQDLFPRQEYLIDLNATQAAIRAGYSAKTARVIGAQNLSKLNISKKIEEAQTKRAGRSALTGDMVVEELRKIAFANMADYMKSDPEGGIQLDFSGLTRDQAAALSQVKVSGESVTFKLHDKRAALVDLGRHLGIFEKQQSEVQVTVDVVDLRETVLRTLDRLAAARAAAGGGGGSEPRTIEGVASLAPLKAIDWSRPRQPRNLGGFTHFGGGGGQIEVARTAVWNAVLAVGGLGSPAGSVLWHVVGWEKSLKEWALEQGWSGQRQVSQEAAAGMLIAALGVLEAHYEAEAHRRG